jgi:predicted regulator of Ras-like GTPase activity (Roadblock/LC7/MglB family)
MGNQAAASDLIGQELELIRKNVPGVRGSVTASSDGLVLVHDVLDLEPTQIAALIAAIHAVAARAAASTHCGQFKEVVTRGSEGYLAVYAAGGGAIVGVLGTSSLNVAMLNFRARTMIDRIAELSADYASRPPAGAPAPAPPPAPAGWPPGGGTLPVRPPRGQ